MLLTIILGGTIIGLAAVIMGRNLLRLMRGEGGCSGCSGQCSSCPSHRTASHPR